MSDFIRRCSSVITAPALFAASVFLLAMGLFLGGKFIAIGHCVAALCFIMVLARTQKWPIRWRALRPSANWLTVFLGIAALSILVNWNIVEYHGAHIRKLRYVAIFLGFLLVPSLHREIIDVGWKREWIVLAWILPMIAAIGLGAVGLVTGSHPLRGNDVVDIERLSGMYGQVLTFANTLQFSLLTLIMLTTSYPICVRLTRVPWWLLVVAMFLAAGGLYLSYTRGAMLGCAVGVFVYAIMRSRMFLLAIVAIGLAAGGIAFKEGARYSNSESSLRMSQWETATRAFLDRPVFGYGFGNFEIQSAKLKERFGMPKDLQPGEHGATEPSYFRSHAHNNILEAFASTGVVGGIAFLAFCYCWIRESFRSRYALYFVPLICAFLVSGLFENTFFDAEVLNSILLIYLFSQIILTLEQDHSADVLSGETTTDT